MKRNMFLTIYKSLIRSTVDYGVTVWYPCSKKNIQMIENIQRRATRIAPDLKRNIKIAKFKHIVIQKTKI